MAKTILGKVGMTPKGAYNNTTEYVRLDVVTKNGQSYVCLKNCSGKDVTNTTYWQLIASKGEMPVNGVDYNTEEDKQAFKEAVVEDSKTEMDNYTADKKEELDTHTIDKKTELNNYKKDLEDEMSTTKENLVEDINNATTENINEFNSNAETKTNAFNDNATKKTTNYNINAETKLKEYNDNTIAKLEEYNTNATNKVNEFNENVDSLGNELTELANQMPWNTTEIQDSINVNDSARYSRNKLKLFGNLKQEVSETENNIFDGIMEVGTITSDTGVNSNSTTIIRSKNYIDISNITYIKAVRSDGYSGDNHYFGVRLYDENKNFLKYTATQLGNGVDLSKTEGIEGYKYLRFIITDTTDLTLKYGIVKNPSGTYEEFIPSKPSIEYPSMPVVATGMQKIIKYGSNLYNIEDRRETNTVYTVDDDDWITISFDNTEGTAATYRNFYKNASKKIKPNSVYYVVIEIKNVTGNGVLHPVTTESYVKGQFKTKVFYNFSNLKSGDIKINEIISLEDFSNSLSMLRTFVSFEAGQSGSITFRLSLLEVKPTVETFIYKPYTEETFELDLGTTELCKMMDSKGNIVAQDRAVYKDGKWQWEKNVSKFINNGTGLINFKLVTSYVADDLLAFVFNADHKHVGKTIAINCDKMPSKYLGHVENINDSNSVRVTEGIAVHDGNTNQIVCSIKKSRLQEENLNGITQFLTENNLTMYFPALVPTYEDCTPAQSEVLDKLYKLSLQKGTNNIYVESENGVTTELQLTYMQDNNIRISNMQEQINALSKAVLDLGGNE